MPRTGSPGLPLCKRSRSQKLIYGLERPVQLAHFRSSGLGHVGPTATGAPEYGGSFLGNVSRMEAVGEVLGHQGDEQRFAVRFCSEKCDAGTEAVSHAVRVVAQVLWTGNIFHDLREHLHALDVPYSLENVFGHPTPQFRLEGLNFPIFGLLFFQQFVEFFDELPAGTLQTFGQSIHFLLQGSDMLQGPFRR